MEVIMAKNRVAIYIRVSTLDQVREGYSLDAQEKALRKWCEDKKYIVHDVYADEGISGKDFEHRPEMLRLMNDAKEKCFDIVAFWALSRFTRSVQDLYATLEKFQKWDISMVSHTEAFDTSTPMGRAMIGIIGVFAQLERELTGERVAVAMQERAEQGKRTCNEILGYDNVGKDSFRINEKEAEYVRFCFEKYIERKSLSEVAELCNQKGYRGKRGKKPTAWSIEKILSHPQYCGYNVFHGILYKGDYEPIVSVKTFNKAHSILIQQGKILGRKRIKEINRI